MSLIWMGDKVAGNTQMEGMMSSDDKFFLPVEVNVIFLENDDIIAESCDFVCEGDNEGEG